METVRREKTMTIDFQLPDSLRSFAEDQASKQGFSNVADFMRSLATEALRRLEQDTIDETEADYGAPEEVTVRSRKQLEEKLLEAVAEIERGEVVDVPPEYFKKLKAE